jgi:transcriptional regulator with XRE-family HTH domain|tara:strand:+ start:2354 stop:2821 length:468 start_codon:yes stop_codon:yes gene_type:complete
MKKENMKKEGIIKYSSDNPNPIDKYVGSRIRLRRTLLGYSQEKLADALGITFQQVQKYENATNRVGASRLHDISQVLGVSVSYFYDGLNVEKDAASVSLDMVAETKSLGLDVSKVMESKETLKLIRYYYSISNDALRQKAYDLIKAMSQEDFEDE